MRPAHPSMYGQPTYLVQQPPMQYYTTNVAGNNHPVPVPLPQYARNPQDLQPMYLVPQQPVMQQQYSALVGVPTQVMGNPVPVPQAMGVVPGGYAPPGWAYRPAMAEPASAAPVWGYGPSAYSNDLQPRQQQQPQQQQQQQQQAQRAASNWQQPGFRVSQGNGFQGRADGHGSGAASQGRIGSHGNGARTERGFEGNSGGGRHYTSGGGQNPSRQARPPQSPAPLQAKQLSCDPCEKTFTVYAQFTAHMNTHVHCDAVGCSFSASGKVVKEHKLTAHCNPAHPSPRKAALKISKAERDEIKAWREERRRNYPTRLNIQRKKEILEGKVARGELIDEDARQRRQRMKEILAKQAELGCPVAEVPEYYLSNKDDRARGRSSTASASASATNAPDAKKRKLGEDAAEERPPKSDEHENSDAKPAPRAEADEAASRPGETALKTQCHFYQLGRCRKGSRCQFRHTRRKRGEGESRGRQKGAAAAAAAAAGKKLPPTLLSKLLRAEITRDKSQILQCFRFFVANNFLLNGVVQAAALASDSDAAESSDFSEGEVVEAPDVLSADNAIISSLLSEQPEVLAKVIEMETQSLVAGRN